MRLVSVLHDLLVCETTNREKRDELQRYVQSTPCATLLLPWLLMRRNVFMNFFSHCSVLTENLASFSFCDLTFCSPKFRLSSLTKISCQTVAKLWCECV